MLSGQLHNLWYYNLPEIEIIHRVRPQLQRRIVILQTSTNFHFLLRVVQRKGLYHYADIISHDHDINIHQRSHR